MAEALGIPHPIIKHEGVWLEFTFGQIAMAALIGDTAYFVILPRMKQGNKNFRINFDAIRRDNYEGIHLCVVEEIRIVCGQKIVDGIPDFLS